MSHSSNEPGSNSSSSRSRAVSLPLACCCGDAALAAAQPRRRALFLQLAQNVLHRALLGTDRRYHLGHGRSQYHAAEKQRRKRAASGDLVAQSGAPARLLGILAPLLDLEALVELRPRRRRSRRRACPRPAPAPPPASRRRVARCSAASAHRVVRGDRGGERARGSPPAGRMRHDAVGDRERRVIALGSPNRAAAARQRAGAPPAPADVSAR